jgi:imidazolonepropionase-like amidohydrolase
MTATAGVMSMETSVGAQQYSDAEMRVIVEEANRHDTPVAAHAHGTEGINAAVRAWGWPRSSTARCWTMKPSA